MQYDFGQITVIFTKFVPNTCAHISSRSIFDWPYYRLAAEMKANKGAYALKNESGLPVLHHGDPAFPQVRKPVMRTSDRLPAAYVAHAQPAEGMEVFDFSQDVVVSWFARACADMVTSSGMDGCFQDQAHPLNFPGVSRSVLEKYAVGHMEVFQEMQVRRW